MSKTYINGELINSATNYAAAIEYTEKDGSKITIQDKLDNFLKDIYPIGSIYISVNNASPNTLFGGIWEKVCQGRTLFGADETHSPGDLVEAGLPNITGGIESTNGNGYQFLADRLTATSGAFSVTGSGAKMGVSADSTQQWGYEGFYLDASKSNAIY